MIPFLKPILPSVERYQSHINKMHENGWYSNNGEFVRQLERDLQEYLQTNREIVIVNNATLGLMLAIKGLDIKGKILAPSFTFVATIGAIQWCNLEYEYIDIDDCWGMDPEATEKALQTGKYEAIMPVHALGLPCNIARFEQLASKYKVKLIFDAASAIGASYNNRRVGNFGDIEVFSLHATKCLPVGEGGFLSIRDKEVADRVRQLKNFGFAGDRSAHIDGTNAKMPEILAAIGVESLKDLKQHMRNRRQYVKMYKNLLSDVVEFQKVPEGYEHGYQILNVVTKGESKEIIKEMDKKGIQLRQYYSPPVHLQPAYFKGVNLLKTTDLCNRALSLPLYSMMDEITIETVCENLKEALKRVK